MRRACPGHKELTPATKKMLAGLLHVDMRAQGAISPVLQCLRAVAVSLADVYEGTAKKLTLPDAMLPLNMSVEDDEDDRTQQVSDYVDAGDV